MSRVWHLVSRQVGRGRAVLAGVLLGALALAAIPSAGTAGTTDYGWTDCNWSYLEASGGTLTWSYDSVFSMPANGSGDGVLNSFTDRVTNSTARWNSALAGTPTNLHLTKVVSAGAKIVVRYQTYPPEPDTWFGTTVLTGIAPGASCTPRPTTRSTTRTSTSPNGPTGSPRTIPDEAIGSKNAERAPERRIRAASGMTSARPTPTSWDTP